MVGFFRNFFFSVFAVIRRAQRNRRRTAILRKTGLFNRISLIIAPYSSLIDYLSCILKTCLNFIYMQTVLRCLVSSIPIGLYRSTGTIDFDFSCTPVFLYCHISLSASLNVVHSLVHRYNLDSTKVPSNFISVSTRLL